jgi:predicted transglutaminase-like cysteine proteinase
MAIEDLILEARAHAAEVKAVFGHVPHPQEMIHRVLAVEHMPGDQVLDTVTGQIGEVVSGGIVQSTDQSAG